MKWVRKFNKFVTCSDTSLSIHANINIYSKIGNRMQIYIVPLNFTRQAMDDDSARRI